MKQKETLKELHRAVLLVQGNLTPEEGELADKLMDRHGQWVAGRADMEFSGLVAGDFFRREIFGTLAGLTISKWVQESKEDSELLSNLQKLAEIETKEILQNPDKENSVHQAFHKLLWGVVEYGKDVFNIQ